MKYVFPVFLFVFSVVLVPQTVFAKDTTTAVVDAEQIVFLVRVPSEVKVGEQYRITWKNGSVGSLNKVLKAYPHVYGQFHIYSLEQEEASPKYMQYAENAISRSAIKKRSIRWTVGSLSEDKQALPEGEYRMVLNLLIPDGEGGATTIGFGESKIFTLSY